ncbi:MAG: NifB/NifX family molybdenum-iron cluster-binding protein [Syntrophales bacterium]|nr:NifB/NifX family molybdenum-iron cluster-binding protein [Syntrophales bacterium]
MKIAVSSSGQTLDDSVDARFGRCAYFLIIDPDTSEFEPIQNPNIALGHGAGIQSAQLLANKGVTVVLTGNCGPNAFQTFAAAGIQVITGVAGQVREAVRMYKSGAVAGASGPNVQGHFGTGMGGGRGMGGRMGRGMGMGGGRGMGGGMGMGGGRGVEQGVQMVPPTSQTAGLSSGGTGKKEEIAALKEKAEALKKQMEEITDRVRKMEGEE